ncbi:MAG: outer membrane channel protein TolC [Colwellia sp.]
MKKTLSILVIAITSTISSTNAQADDLLSIYQQALLNDPVVLKAQAQFMIVKEDIEQARAVLLPQISASAGYTIGEYEAYTTPLEPVYNTEYSSLAYSANLSMQLYHHDSWLRLGNAKKSAHQSDLTYQIAQQDLITRVAYAYFSLLNTKDDLVFAMAEKDAIARQLEQTKQRFSVGLTAITDVYEAQAQFDTAVTEEIRSENAIFQAEEELRVITNTYPRNISTLNTKRFTTSTPVPNSADEWQVTAEAKNLDLITAKVGIDIAKENINIARSGHYPTVDFAANYDSDETETTISNTTIKGPEVNGYYLGLQLNVPIYSGGAIESSVRQAQNQFVLASQDLSLTHRNVVRTTRNAYNTVIAAISAIKAYEQSVLSATKALEATEAGFEVGTRTIVDVLDSTRNLYDAKRNLSSTRYDYIQNVLLLKRAAGTITVEDVNAINSGLIALQQ